eukprot:scaffold133817_cov32-Tisochrysis_lutea.AAC.1
MAWSSACLAVGGVPPGLEAASAPLLLLVPETVEFRTIARALASPGDVVLELGCSYGEATALLLEKGCRQVVAADNSVECLKHVQEELMEKARGRLRLQLIDVLRYPAQLAALATSLPLDLLLLDIGGNRDLESVVTALLSLESSGTRPRLVLVKSRELVEKAKELAMTSAEGTGAMAEEGMAGSGILQLSWPTVRMKLNHLVASSPTHSTQCGDDKMRAAISGSADVLAEHNPNCAPGETRLCHAFLNTGRCIRKKGCSFRHVLPEHPAALADTAKRSQLGWLPNRLAAKVARELEQKVASEHDVTTNSG